MRSDRFISIVAVIALLATVQTASAASDDGWVSTVTLTKTVYNRPSSSSISVSGFEKSRGGQHDHNQPHQSTVQPKPITHHITEIHHATQTPRSSSKISSSSSSSSSNHVVSSASPKPINSASSVVIVTAYPYPAKPTNVNEEEVIVKTKTKKNKTIVKTKTRSKNSTAMPAVTQSTPMMANPPVQTAPASVSQQPGIASPMVSNSISSSAMVMMPPPSGTGSANLPMVTAPSSSSPAPLLPGAPVPPADAVPGMPAPAPQAPINGGSGSAMPTVMVASPPPATPSSAAPPQAPSIDSVNNANKKINPPTASTHPVSGGASLDRSVGPALVLAWLMAAVAAI